MRFPGFQLSGKKILIISPQPWSKMRISKHHYALILAEKGNEIYFLGPPIDSGKPGIVIEPAADVPGIMLINYTPAFNPSIRFRLRWVFDKLIRRDVKKIVHKIGNPDITWCFETNIYSDLRWFNARLNIFHVVDPVAFDYQKNVGNTADIIICVSNRILKEFENANSAKHFVNHGLCRPYAELAEKKLSGRNIPIQNEPVKVGYIGNLTRGPVNHEVFYRLTSLYQDIEFHFWGNFSVNDQNSEEEIAFVNYLKSAENVFLHGVTDPDELVKLIADINLFLLIYKYIPGESDLSNSHKLLEYLSTGKHIVSSPVETYLEFSDIIFMPSSNQENENELVDLFSASIEKIEFLNSEELQQKRIKLSLCNTYEHQLTKIENLIAAL